MRSIICQGGSKFYTSEHFSSVLDNRMFYSAQFENGGVHWLDLSPCQPVIPALNRNNKFFLGGNSKMGDNAFLIAVTKEFCHRRAAARLRK